MKRGWRTVRLAIAQNTNLRPADAIRGEDPGPLNRSSWRTFRSRTAVVSELVAGGEFILRSSCFATSSNDPFSVLHEFSLCSQPGDATLGERERASIFRGSVSPSNGRWFVHGVRNAYDNEHDPGQDDLKVCGDRLRGSRPLRLRELCANLLLS